MAVEGTERLLRALAAVEEDATSKNVHLAAAEVVMEEARPLTPRRSGELQRSGRTSATKKRGVVRFGGPRVPWAGPVHFGAPAPRPQGGFIRPDPWLYEAGDRRRDEVADLFARKTDEAVRRRL